MNIVSVNNKNDSHICTKVQEEDIPILSVTIKVGLNAITAYRHAKTFGLVLVLALSFLRPFLFQSDLEPVV